MAEVVRLRPRGVRALGAAMMMLAVVGLGSCLLGGADVLLRLGAPLALFGVIGWASFWEPYVEVSDGGVTVANTLRTVRVPWPSVQGVNGRYGLALDTAYGAVTAWAASAPTGRARARGEQGRAAIEVSRRLEALQAAGHLDAPRLEDDFLRWVWHLPLLTGIVVLLVAAVMLPLIA